MWKFCKGTGFQVCLSFCIPGLTRYSTRPQLLHVRTGCVKAVYADSPSHVAKGVFKGQFKSCLRIHPSCMLDLDILVLTFIVMEKKRRDNLGDQVNIAAAEEESIPEASGMEGGGLM